MTGAWPVPLAGITETVVTTPLEAGRWNLAALGIVGGTTVIARTWGRTRTRRNFEREGVGFVQFTRDPMDFVDAAHAVIELDDPILASSDAWVRVRVRPLDGGTDRGTEWRQWALEPQEATIRREYVPTINRGFAALVEATVAASRLDVLGYDRDRLVDRLAECRRVVDRCGSDRDRRAFDRLTELTDWNL